MSAWPVAEVDIETVAVDWCKADPTLTALVPPAMIGGRFPRALRPGDTALRIRRIGGPALDNTGWLVHYRLQVDALGPTELEAFAVAAAADVTLRRLQGQVHLGVVVTAAGRDLAISNLPDPDTDLPRYVVGIALDAHPAPA